MAQLEDREVVLLNNGDFAKISGTGSIKKTSTLGLGWHQAQYGGEHGEPLDLDGHYVYFDDERVRADITFMAPSHYNDDGLNELGDYKNYLATVYNIEVEDYHTYFVGEMGVWVHNTNCGAREGGGRRSGCSEEQTLADEGKNWGQTRPDQLIADFQRDIERWNHENRDA